MGFPASFLFAVCATTWTGCAGVKWCHPDPKKNTQAQFDRDKYQCHGEALERASNFGAPGNIFIIIDYQKQCMRVRGWTTACPVGGTESAPQVSPAVSSLRAKIKKAYQEKRYDDCISIYTELLQSPDLTTKQKAGVYHGRGSLYIRLKKYRLALADLEVVKRMKADDTKAIESLPSDN